MCRTKLLLLFCLYYIKLSVSCKDEIRCHVTRIHGMRSADCFHMEIRKFPKCLGSGVEVIDLSMNRLRKLTKENLDSYSNIKMLYLSDNSISKIDDDVFEDQTSLTTLDISMNPLTMLPPVIFHLPSLKTLYLSQMVNMNIAEIVDGAKPITSPLNHLDISASELTELPNLGIIPTLTKLNISMNDVYPLSMSIDHISGLCNLKVFDTSNVTVTFDDKCDCWNINRWLHVRDVKFTPFRCTVNEKACPYIIQFEHMQNFNNCEQLYQKLEHQSRLMKIGLPIGIALIIIILLAIYLLWFIRRKRYKNQTILKEKPEGLDLL